LNVKRNLDRAYVSAESLFAYGSYFAQLMVSAGESVEKRYGSPPTEWIKSGNDKKMARIEDETIDFLNDMVTKVTEDVFFAQARVYQVGLWNLYISWQKFLANTVLYHSVHKNAGLVREVELMKARLLALEDIIAQKESAYKK
jgi:hypothetical protein